MIAGFLARLGLGRIAGTALRVGLLIAAVLLLFVSLRRSGERVGRVLERLETSERTSAGCWRRRLVVLAIVTCFLSGCAKVGTEPRVVAVCPPVVGYGAELQVNVAAELETLSEGSELEALLSDCAVMRDQARACAAH